MIYNNVLGKKAAKLQSKSVTITSNGTINIKSDSGYDGLSEAIVNVNVSASTAVEKCTIVLTHSGSSQQIAYAYQCVKGSSVDTKVGTLAIGASVTLSDVACGSLFAAVTGGDEFFSYSANITGEKDAYYDGEYTTSILCVITPKTENSTGTITVMYE